ncbi:HTH-type transcriptional regulator BetI [mine drainage metagenome]|uniref:HTH-type transcriptional regulator BetI n=1 Tax=mine drainage metagenome TaxID=410659 RepID=A0A1J5T3H4_9ZZZZ
MRYDAEHRQQTREKVVRKAAEVVREFGPDKISVAELMAKVGLTHGGFYAHFKSKDDLVREAISHIFNERNEALRNALEDAGPSEGLSAYIDMYLSTLHRNRRDKGCPMAALIGDLARMPVAVRKRFDADIQVQTDLIAGALKEMKQPQPDALAASVLAEMVGAIAIARAVSDDETSERILDAARTNIKARIGLAAHK